MQLDANGNEVIQYITLFTYMLLNIGGVACIMCAIYSNSNTSGEGTGLRPLGELYARTILAIR